MATISSHSAVRGVENASRTTSDLVARALEITLGVAIAAALTSAWLAFVWIAPIDLRLR